MVRDALSEAVLLQTSQTAAAAAKQLRFTEDNTRKWLIDRDLRMAGWDVPAGTASNDSVERFSQGIDPNDLDFYAKEIDDAVFNKDTNRVTFLERNVTDLLHLGISIPAFTLVGCLVR